VEVKLSEEGNATMKKYGYGSVYFPYYYKTEGTVYLFGTLNMTAVNPITGEKFWKKSVTLPRKQVVLQGETQWTGTPTVKQMLSDNGVYNPIAKALESYYADALDKSWRHISVEEFKMIAAEIKKANTSK